MTACRTRAAVALTCTGIAVAFAACTSTPASGPDNPGAGRGRGGAAPPVPVTVGEVAHKAMPLEVRAIGSVEPSLSVAIRAQVTGVLTSVNFTEGDDVSEGQVLFTLDHRPLESAVKQAEANLQRDIAQVANAREQAKRIGELAQRGIATREQVDTSRATVAALEGTLGADEAAVENARVQLEYATIKAPTAGRTGALIVHPGNLIRANDMTPLVVINQLTPIRVVFAVPEAQLATVKRYMAEGDVPVDAVVPNDPKPAAGRITFIDNTVDQTTGTLATDPNALVVETLAIQTGPEGSYVYVVKPDQTVEFRPVQVGRVVGTESIVASGLTAGETVVTDGHLRLVPGSRIARKENLTKVSP
ncbi:MAG: efflux RND transporter periplasmic adaptor subunit [Candidatus Eisenbacteria bacterium]|uniref:Efflux RND transporter periplasmic adaptor subunit n=1 Tax=Eiseniibacteriota bacterium TaxID=2212470 RepID=A0A538ST75_UNCEI|nr:MAG: efflux RND transporter periplasmic adaptor subunit [Candidatus Eisenbacteria bacterium]